MRCLRGTPALSDFRLAKLIERLSDAGFAGCELYAEYMHFVDLDGSLTADQQAVLERLLQYGPRRSEVRVTHSLPGTRRPTGAGGAAAWHDLALVVQGHGHRS
jgi:hypothetical protein